MTRSNAASRSTGSPLQTSSMASRVQPPENTDRRASSSLLGGVEKLVGPVDRGPQRRMALDRPASPARENLESAIQPAQQIGRAQRDHPGGGQFDGEWHTIETLTNLHYRPGVAVGQREVGFDVSRPLDEQADCIGVYKVFDVVTRLGPPQAAEVRSAVHRRSPSLLDWWPASTTPGQDCSMRLTRRATEPSTCSQLSSTNRSCF